MHSATKRLAIILTSIVLLPLIAYVVYEISNLNKEEQMLREIYNRQLESVLFSINQYSNDIISRFADNVEQRYDPEDTTGIAEYVNYFPVPVILIINNSIEDTEPRVFSFQYSYPSLSKISDSTLTSNLDNILRLRGYQQSGYRKLQPVGEVTLNEKVFSVLLFVSKYKEQWIEYLLLVSPVDFVQGILGPRLQEIASKDFLIQVRKQNSSEPLFSTDSVIAKEYKSSDLWEISGYELAISLKEKSINEIVKSRTQLNLLAVLILSLVLIFGFILVLRNLNREVQLAQSKSEFVSNVSHEIRTPLSLISMFAETLLLERVKTEAKKKEYYLIISKETARLRNIVNKILNFSKIEAGRKSYHFSTINLNHVVKDVISTYAFHFENNGFNCSESYTDNLPNVNGDQEAIIEAIINLLDNAIKYSPKNKQLEISTGHKEGYAYFAVKDHGIGIDPKKRKQIFDKFYRITEGDLYESKGTGLGLSLVKHIMDAHRGRIEIDSALGSGSTFRLLFPIKAYNHA
jgi:two-component system phosphate regulon sensor histidine kinase PhoR